MRKKFILLFLIGIGFLPFHVLAAEDCAAFKTANNNGKIKISAISPNQIESVTEETDELHITKDEYLTRMDDEFISLGKIIDYADFPTLFNSDYSKFDLYIKDGKLTTNTTQDEETHAYVHEGEKCTFDVEWETYDSEKGKKVLEFIRSIPDALYMDTLLIKHQKEDVTATNDDENPIESFPNVKQKLTDPITYKQYWGRAYCSAIAYRPDDGKPDYGDDNSTLPAAGVGPFDYQFLPHSNICDDIPYLYVFYDDVLYYFAPNSKFYSYPVFYIPEFTKNDTTSYLEAARDRISAIFGSAGVTYMAETDSNKITYIKSMIQYGMDKGYINKTLNSSFEPIYATVTTSLGTDGKSSVPIQVLLAKAKEEQVLANTNEEYRKLYAQKKAQAESITGVPDTAAFSAKAILIFGIIVLTAGLSIVVVYIYKDKLFTQA